MEQEKSQQNKKQNAQFVRMTTEPIPKLLGALAVPSVISMMVTNIYNIVDTAFVGTLGTSQSGATGVVFGFMAILQAVAFMCGQGSGSIMSRRLGEKDTAQATKYSSTGFFLSFFLGTLMAIGTFCFMEPLLDVLGSTVTIAPYAKIYISFIAISAPFFTSSLTMNNLLRYEGKAKLGTVGMMTGAFINIGLDALLMFVFKLGIAGAGIATAVSQFTSFCILLSMFLRKKTQTRISVRFVARNFRVFWEIMATGFPSLVRQGLNSIVTMMLNNRARVYGDEAVSAMSIVSRVSFFPMAIAIGVGQGFQPISSFNYGAGKFDRVRKAFGTALLWEEIVLSVLAIPMFVFSPQLVAMLRDDPRVIEIGTRALHLVCLSQVFIPITMMVEMGYQSIGAKLLATICSSLRSGLIFIPTLAILAKVRGLNGIQESQPVSFILSFFVCLVLCKIYLDRLKAREASAMK